MSTEERKRMTALYAGVEYAYAGVEYARNPDTDKLEPVKATTVAERYRNGEFNTEQGAQTAFQEAYDEASYKVDVSTTELMGLTMEEFTAWIQQRKLPER